MSWSNGSNICLDIWKAIRKDIDVWDRPEILAKIIKVLEESDWNCPCDLFEDEFEDTKEEMSDWKFETSEALKLAGIELGDG